MPLVAAPPAQAVVPNYQVATQYIAKLYTEGLGRAPDATSWASIQNSLLNSGCSVSSLKPFAQTVLKSAEFAALYPLPDSSSNNFVNAARILALFRTTLNREPDTATFNSVFSTLNGSETQTTWNNIVDNFVNGTGYSSLVTGSICPANDSRRDPSSYYWNTGNQAPMLSSMPASPTCGFSGGTQAQLQTQLNSAPAGGTVLLAQGAEILITQALIIPAGKTLRTCQPTDPGGTGLPTVGTGNYALMGRLYRDWNRAPNPDTTWNTTASVADNATVRVSAGATLKNVFVDGGRNNPENTCVNANPIINLGCIDVYMHGGSGTKVNNNRLDNSGGWDVVYANGAIQGEPCSGTNYIQNNLITGYSSAHLVLPSYPTTQVWLDGISVNCEKAEVSGNHVIDATDVPIIVFRACHGAVAGGEAAECAGQPAAAFKQDSDVHDNIVLAAGNSAYGAIWLSATDHPGPGWPYAVADFSGTTVTSNHTWTSVNTIFDALYFAGIRMAFNNTCPGTGCWTASHTRRANGAFITNNDTSGQLAYVEQAVGISGMTALTLTGNNFGQAKVAGAGVAGLPSSWTGPFTCPTISSAGGPGAIVGEFTSYEPTYPHLWWASGTISGNTVGTGSQYYDSPLVTNAAGPYPSGCMTQVYG